MDIQKAIEALRCAEINCDNIKKVGLVMVEVVKDQIQTALRELGDDDDEEGK